MRLERVCKITLFADAVFLEQVENLVYGKTLRNGDANRAAHRTLIVGKGVDELVVVHERIDGHFAGQILAGQVGALGNTEFGKFLEYAGIFDYASIL